MIPKVNNCAPEKMAIIEAKKGNPATDVPTVKRTKRTYASIPMPKSVNKKPIRLARRKGVTAKPVIIL